MTATATAAVLDIVGEFAKEEEGRVGLLESVARALLHTNSRPIDGGTRARDESGTKRIVDPAASIPAAVASDVKAIHDVPAAGTKRFVDPAPSIPVAVARDVKAIDDDSDNEDGADVDDVMDIGPPANDGGEDEGASTTAIADPSVADDAEPPLSLSAAACGGRIPKDQEKQDKESLLMFLRVLMNFLEQKDAGMHAAAKAQIEECVEKSKSGNQQFGCLATCMTTRLRSTVGEVYWKKAHDYLDLLNQKREAHQMGNNPSVQQQGTRVQQQQVLAPSAHRGGNPTVAARIPTLPLASGQQQPQQHQVAPPLQLAATATKKETIPLSRPSRAAKPQSISPVSVPIPVIVQPNTSSTNVSVPPAPAIMVTFTSKKEIEARKRKKDEKGEEGGTKKEQKRNDAESANKRLAEMLCTTTMPTPKFCDDIEKNRNSMKKKAVQRSYDFDNSSIDVSKNDVTALLSATSKFAERSSQQNAQFSRQQVEADLIKLNCVLRSKSGQRDSLIQMAHLYNTLGDNDKARLELERAGEVISAIDNIEEDLMQRRTKYTQDTHL